MQLITYRSLVLGSDQESLDDNFDYMEMLETQYQQYYAMAAVPPFDPNAPPPLPPVVGAPLIANAHDSSIPPGVVSKGPHHALLTSVPPPSLIDPSLAQALPDLVAQTPAAILAVPFMQIPVFASMSMTPFIAVDENVLKEYIRKQV